MEAHEKGLIENLVGYVRRNFLVPLPSVESFEQLNAIRAERCQSEGDRQSSLRGTLLVPSPSIASPNPMGIFYPFNIQVLLEPPEPGLCQLGHNESPFWRHRSPFSIPSP